MNEIVKLTGEHLHSLDILAVNCLEVKDRMKRKARQTHDTTHHILRDELKIITGTTAAKLPKLDSMKRTIRRERQVNHLTEKLEEESEARAEIERNAANDRLEKYIMEEK
ncbi:hypothetical protein LOD99_7615 [Oopsacas minuta]|uniref:Uncharacterized protein n=1 Tax=Oopsacas minuta TaxID=111878 RepID=A0AAV7JNV6_9METZ|nr:hypothetical protein LOD99_7615 [Oopsacas minuta]